MCILKPDDENNYYDTFHFVKFLRSMVLRQQGLNCIALERKVTNDVCIIFMYHAHSCVVNKAIMLHDNGYASEHLVQVRQPIPNYYFLSSSSEYFWVLDKHIFKS